MASDESRMVLEEWNETHQPYRTDVTAPMMFEEQATSTPDVTAVVFEGTMLTYREFMRCTAPMAGRLQGVGVGNESVVGLCVEKSIEEVAGMVSIMRAGGAYVPLDPKLPQSRLMHLVEQCECDVSVAMRKHARAAESLGVDVVVAEEQMRSDCEWCGRGREHNADSLAIVMFTSGSTGKPKGVMLEQRALVVHLTLERTVYLDLDVESGVLYATPFTFDVSWGLVWTTLTTGARLCIAKPDALLDPPYVQKFLFEQGIVHGYFVPTPLSVYMEASEGALPPSLRILYVSGTLCPSWPFVRLLWFCCVCHGFTRL